MQFSQNYFRLIGIIIFVSSILCSASSFGKVPPELVIKSFQAHFENASHVTWHQEKQVYYATFTNGEERWIAYLRSSGELVTSGRRILIENLPLMVQRNMKSVQASYEKKYGALTPVWIYELIATEQTTYLITLENKNRYLALQAVNDNINVVVNKRKTENTVIEKDKDIIAKK